MKLHLFRKHKGHGKFLVLFAALVFLLLPALPVLAGKEKRVVVFIPGRLSLAEIRQLPMPHMHMLMERGASGLMNTNTAAGRTLENAMATLAAGRVSCFPAEGGLAINGSEDYRGQPASRVFAARTGQEASPDAVLVLSLPRARNKAEQQGRDLNLGLLGKTLHQAGKKTAVLGNADVAKEYHREAAILAMDQVGLVDMGDVGPGTLKPGTGALRMETDYQKMLAAFRKAYSQAALTVVSPGDLERLESVREELLPTVYTVEKERLAAGIDTFLGQLVQEIDWANTQFYLLSPLPSADELAGKNLMAPVTVAGSGIEPGYLTSPTTRRRGIISNTDIAPSILAFLDLPVPTVVTGRPMSVLAGSGVVAELAGLNRQMVFTYVARPAVVKPYVVVQIVVVLGSLVVLFLLPHLSLVLRIVLLWLMSVPLSLLVVSRLETTSIVRYGLAAFFVAVLMVLAVLPLRRNPVNPFLILGLATSLAILLDLATGAHFMQRSTLGYDPMAGARYYGLGNEYMGVLIGASILGAAAVCQRWPHRKPLLPVLTYFAATVYLIASPRFGINVGGTIASIVAFSYTLLRLVGRRFSKLSLAGVAALGTLVLISLALNDMFRNVEGQSHLGRVATMVASGGWCELVKVAGRKLAMNYKLIKYTIWSRVFLAALFTLALLFYRPVGVIEQIKRKYPYLFTGFLGIMAGSFAALIANDSGIVAAATMMIFGVAPLLYLASLEVRR